MDTEKFIKCVKNNPTIWKKSAKNYGDRVMRESCWNIIGHQMFDSWEEKTDEERHEEVINMKNKWRHMRDSYNKYINQVKSRYSGVKKRRYLYADNLSFLLQRGCRSETDTKQSNNQVNTNQDTSERTQPKPQTISPKTTNKTPEKGQSKQQVIKNTGTSRGIEEDPDRCYLLSLLPEFRKLTDDQKLDFRFHTLQFFRVVRNKRLIRKPDGVNGWSDSMECDIVNPVVGMQPPSPCQSPRAPQAASFPNSPRESVESEHSASTGHRNSPQFENVKMELF